MTKAPEWLLEFKSNTYSQTGEDGVLGKILEVLPANDKWCVEFGAWDGIAFSNTRNLIEHAGYSAVLIEGSKARTAELKKNYAANKNVIGINAFVGFTERDGLDALLAPTPIPKDFDLLSIDVDGNDYHIWKAVSTYRPKLVCIEFNPSVPTEVDFVQPADPRLNQGAGLRPLVDLGRQKGYELVSVLPWNAVFVDAKYFPLFEIDDNRPETLRKDLSYITYLFSGYDGTMFIRGQGRLPWHGFPLEESAMQKLPRFLRKYPGNYGAVEVAAYRFFSLCSSPGRVLRNTYRRLTQGSA